MFSPSFLRCLSVLDRFTKLFILFYKKFDSIQFLRIRRGSIYNIYFFMYIIIAVAHSTSSSASCGGGCRPNVTLCHTPCLRRSIPFTPFSLCSLAVAVDNRDYCLLTLVYILVLMRSYCGNLLLPLREARFSLWSNCRLLPSASFGRILSCTRLCSAIYNTV